MKRFFFALVILLMTSEVLTSGDKRGEASFLVDTFNFYISVYRKLISSQDLPSCVFEPSCSRFSEQAVREFGFIKGFLLTGDRLTRCNPFAYRYYHEYRAGKLYDPVERYRLGR